MSLLLDQALHQTLTVKSASEANALLWTLGCRLPAFPAHEQATVKHYQWYLKQYIRSGKHGHA